MATCEFCRRSYDIDYSDAYRSRAYCSKRCEASAENAEENDRRYNELQEENDRRQEENDRRYEDLREENENRQRANENRLLEQKRENKKLREEMERERAERKYNEEIIKCTFCGEEYRRINGFPSEDILGYYHLLSVLDKVQRTERQGKRFTSQGLKKLIKEHESGDEIDFCSKECRTKYKQVNASEIDELKHRSVDARDWLAREIATRRNEERNEKEIHERERLAKEEEDRRQLLSEYEKDICRAKKINEIPYYGLPNMEELWEECCSGKRRSSKYRSLTVTGNIPLMLVEVDEMNVTYEASLCTEVG